MARRERGVYFSFVIRVQITRYAWNAEDLEAGAVADAAPRPGVRWLLSSIMRWIPVGCSPSRIISRL